MVGEMKVDADLVRLLHATVAPIQEHCNVSKLIAELPTYTAITEGVATNKSDIDVFTSEVLQWWQKHHLEVPEWSKAARIIFAFSANSAGCERVFSLLKVMFGDQQHKLLADYLQGRLMLRYNGRQVG